MRSADTLETETSNAFRLPWLSMLACLLMLAVVCVLSVINGAAGLSLRGLLTALLDLIPFVNLDPSLTELHHNILMRIRLPRLVLGLLVGGSLGMAGASYQGVFRNPLADPYLLGVSAGAGFGAVLVIGFGLDLGWGPFGSVPVAAFIGAIAAVSASSAIARGSWSSPATLLLAGVAMASMFSAAQTYVLQKLSQTRAREVLSWLFGQLNTSGWQQIWVLIPYMAVCGMVLLAHCRHLDVLRVGDDEARALGLNPARSRLIIIAAASLLTAAAVSVSGLIAFVGLVVPHIVRILVNNNYRVILPLSAVTGAAFLAFVDIGARTLVAPSELPVGVVTAFIGAPFFASLLWWGRGIRP
ncbi:MAG: iron ABC transporter permease [Acidimicrobiaceae bacterium]|nr:iron ABC transporter permease [Acidimicrobiaceae bacterium]